MPRPPQPGPVLLCHPGEMQDLLSQVLQQVKGGPARINILLLKEGLKMGEETFSEGQAYRET